MNGAFFVTWKHTSKTAHALLRLGTFESERTVHHCMFDNPAARDERADELRECGYDVTTSDGT